jgi:8-oxo-dGTP pyrophosphatase MutT (NUDIX family)
VPADQSDKVHAAVALGFDFHMVVDKKLVLTTWLDTSTPSRLPIGPTHQVGVGCLVLHPRDPSRMLVVQEKSGPAAAFRLWKMPTGLADPGEDIPDAAVRELREETGLASTFRGVLAFRQAHATGAGTVSRANSDLFFVCRMDLTSYDDSDGFTACPDEITDIKWMPVEEYCAQERWQGSPVYVEMNRAILESSRHVLFGAQTLPLGFAGGANTLYKSPSSAENL